jgi:hypothetical protein
MVVFAAIHSTRLRLLMPGLSDAIERLFEAARAGEGVDQRLIVEGSPVPFATVNGRAERCGPGPGDKSSQDLHQHRSHGKLSGRGASR